MRRCRVRDATRTEARQRRQAPSPQPGERQNAEPLLVGAGWTRQIRLHDLRHGCATMPLAAGVHPEVVQERGAQANLGITFDTYSDMAARLHIPTPAEKVAGLVFQPGLGDG